MKKIMLIMLAFGGIPAFAQKIDAAMVPASVKAAFNKSFAAIKEVKWEKEKGNYEANFRQDGQKLSALFTATGALLETETGISISALPENIKEYIKNNYKGAKIKEAAKLNMANGDNNYEAEVNGIDLIFEGNGNFIKKIKD